MSKKQFKLQASSSRAVSSAPTTSFGFSSPSSFTTPTSPLSYLNELPDLSSISNANTVVAFKNLSKKDSTTKAKALEELQSLLPKDGIEDGILETWINIYPRTSIDSSRRVRQLTHTVHGQIASAAGKKIAKYMSRAVGAWLAGLYDNDKLVAKAALDALAQVFPTTEKLRVLRKAYQEPLLAFIRDVIENETPQTLSDERNVSPDEAASKYARVVAASIGLLSSLLAELSEEDLRTCIDQYDELFNNKALWELGMHEDATIRRTTHKLLRAYLQERKDPTTSVLDILSSVYVYKGLDSDQSTSASDYLESLIALTQLHPTVWTDHYHGKKPVKSRLRHFFKRGSQNSTRNFWSLVSTLFATAPSDILPTDLNDAEDLLKALHAGFTKKEEPRTFITDGFRAYIRFASRQISVLTDENQIALLENTILPILVQFLRKDSNQTSWELPASSAREILDQVLNLDGMMEVVAKILPDISNQLVSEIKLSLPEESQNYVESQDKIASLGERYASLLGSLLKTRNSGSIHDPVISSLLQVLSTALEVCKERNGKPYGSAAVVAAIVLSCPSALGGSDEISQLLDEFAKDSIPKLMLSPSSNGLITLLRATKERPPLREAQVSALESVMEAPNLVQNVSTFTELVRLVSVTQPERFEGLKPAVQGYVDSFVSAALEDTSPEKQKQDRWKNIATLISSTKDAGTAIDQVLSTITGGLTLEDESKTVNILEGVQLMSKRSPGTLGMFVAHSAQSKDFLQKLLLLTESPNNHVARLATELNAAVHANIAQMPNMNAKGGSMLDLIHRNLNDASFDSVSVETLMGHVRALLKQTESSSKLSLLPSSSVWSQKLQAFLVIPPTTAFTITNHLGGALYMVHSSVEKSSSFHDSIRRDSDGLCIPLRMALYTTTLLEEVMSFHDLNEETRADIFRLLYVTLLLMSENLGVKGSHGLWILNMPDIERHMLQAYNKGMDLISKWLRDPKWKNCEGHLDPKLVKSTFGVWITEPSDGAVSAYYHAEARSAAVSELIDAHGWPSRLNSDLDTVFRSLTRSPDIVRLCDFIVEHKVPLTNFSAAQRFCNELVTDLTYADISQESDKAFRKLVILNTMLQHLEGINSTIAKQRLVFFVKKVVGWLKEQPLPKSYVAELCKILTVLLPDMNDIYGDHWADIMSYIVEYWQKTSALDESGTDSELPAIHASIRLFSSLRRLKGGTEPNDDLVDAWSESESAAAEGLLNLVKLPRETPDRDHQPLRVVDELIARMVKAIPIHHLPDTSDLFHLLDSNSESVQEVTYKVLHERIPEQQQQISVDTALESKEARLPDELLSLILETPPASFFEESDFLEIIPLPLRSYMFSWMLVFDHFENAVRAST